MDDNAPATRTDLKQAVDQLRSEMQHQYDDLKETLRDSETKLLQAFYSFAETNQKRLTETEREAAALKDRLAIVESRLIDIEKRLNMPPAA